MKTIILILENNSILKEYQSDIIPVIEDMIAINETDTFKVNLRLINFETNTIILSGKII